MDQIKIHRSLGNEILRHGKSKSFRKRRLSCLTIQCVWRDQKCDVNSRNIFKGNLNKQRKIIFKYAYWNLRFSSHFTVLRDTQKIWTLRSVIKKKFTNQILISWYWCRYLIKIILIDQNIRFYFYDEILSMC